jgi:hypothetical protein
MGKYRRKHRDNHVYALKISSPKNPCGEKLDDIAYIMPILPR